MTSLRRILLATDLEPKSDRAMERAVQLACQFGAELTALHVFHGAGGPYDHLPLHHVEAELRRHVLAVPGGAGIVSQALAVRGEAVGQGVARYAGLWRPDLVVVGLHQRDRVADLLLPTTIERIAVADGTPLLIVRDKPLGPYARALVPVDFSERSRPSFEAARMLVPTGSVHLLHVFDIPAAARPSSVPLDAAEFAGDFHDVLAGVDEAGSAVGLSTVGMIVRTGSPVHQIVGMAREGHYDLVAMGSARRNGLSRAFLGSIAHEVLDGLPCDALIAGEPPGLA
ncbi:universal stress protein [Azospirillum doebereinerae]